MDRGVVDRRVLDRRVLDRCLVDRGLLDRRVLDRCLVDRGLLDRRVLDRGLVDRCLVDRGLLDRCLVDRGLLDRCVLDRGLLDGRGVERPRHPDGASRPRGGATSRRPAHIRRRGELEPWTSALRGERRRDPTAQEPTYRHARPHGAAPRVAIIVGVMVVAAAFVSGGVLAAEPGTNMAAGRLVIVLVASVSRCPASALRARPVHPDLVRGGAPRRPRPHAVAVDAIAARSGSSSPRRRRAVIR